MTYHSWKKPFKEPFGAVQVNKQVTFRVKKESDSVTGVTLLIHKDGEHGKTAVPLVYNRTTQYFEGKYPLEKGQGLYFYRFQIERRRDGESTLLYLGNHPSGYSGQAYLYQDNSEAHDFQLTAYQTKDPAPDWYRKGVAYHIFIDRFYNGNEDGRILNPKRDAMIYTEGAEKPHYIKDKEGKIVRWDFFGGNLLGVIKKLPYLEELGVSILYLSPIFKSRSNHKYDTGDYFEIDEMFGDLETFEDLIAQAEKHGMQIILDGVFNHVGADSRYFNQFNTYGELGAYQSKESPYYEGFTFTDFPDEFESWWGVKDLPRLNTENPQVKDFVYGREDSVVGYWTKKGIGGWRLDVADELSDDFLKGIRKRLETSGEESVLIGEVWEDASNKVAYGKRRHYIEGDILHGVMNYPFRKIIVEYVNGEIKAKEAECKLLHLKENYPRDILYNNLNNIGTHDTERIRTVLAGYGQDEKVRQGFQLLFMLPGVPTIYYGDEAGLEGGKDPDNRRPFPWKNPDTQLQDFIRDLAHERRSNKSLIEGDFFAFECEELLLLLRYIDERQWTIGIFNTTDHFKTVHYRNITNETSFDVRYFIEKNIDDHFFTQVPAHGCKLFKSQS